MDHSIYEDFGAHERPHTVVADALERPLLPVAEVDGRVNAGVPTDLSAKDLAKWRWANVDNLDVFLQEVYQYYLDKGFYCILLTRALNMATILFVVSFATYLCSCLDYKALATARSLDDVRIHHCIAKTSLLHKLVLWLFGAFWFAKCFQYVSDVRRLWELHDFFLHLLDITENEIQTISWQQVVERIVKLRSTNLVAGRPNKRPLDAHGIVNRIMRKENYMIALYNRNVLDLNLSLPFVGNYQFLTKTLEWSISLCILDFVFTERGHLRPAFLNEAKRTELAAGLRRRFQFAAIMNILFAPAAIVYMTLYYFFRYFNDFKSHPANLGMRHYTPLAEWKMRELNELYHLFKRRLSMSDAPARRYISQFPRERTEIVLRFVMFICSSFLAILVTLSLWEPHLVNVELTNEKSVSIYIAALGVMIAVCRGMLADEASIYQPETAMRQIVEFTHYLPDEWEGRLHTEEVKNEFCVLYDLNIKIILRDLMSIIVNPAILAFRLADSSEKVVDYFRQFSIHVDDLGGYVCSYAVFNFDQANKVKARAEALDRYYATADGKMLKSYLNFMDVYGPPSRRRGPTGQFAANQYGGMSTIAAQGLNGSNGAHTSQQANYYAQMASTASLGSSSSHAQGENSYGAFPGGMAHSVMGEFERLRHLEPVQEHSRTASTGNNTVSTDLNMLYSDDDDEEAADNGVLGLLNNLYKTDGRSRH